MSNQNEAPNKVAPATINQLLMATIQDDQNGQDDQDEKLSSGFGPSTQPIRNSDSRALKTFTEFC
jgi:hypothetical protein